MKKYLIIGGAGFIGSHLSKSLSEMGKEVVVVDNFSANTKDSGNGKIKVYKTDVENQKETSELFKKERPDFVFHLAGAINLRRDISDPLFAKDLNILERTNSILESFRQSEAKKFIFISSGGAIYENAGIIPTPESYQAHPNSLYGLANLIIEKYVETYCKKNSLNFSILRLSNVYGPRQWKSGIIPSIITKILAGGSPVIYGTGNQTRDFIYIDDAVKAMILSTENGSNEIYNVGSGQEISLNEVLKMVTDITGSEISPVYEKNHKEEINRSVMDIEKVKKDFGWEPEVNIKDGLAKTVSWHKENAE